MMLVFKGVWYLKATNLNCIIGSSTQTKNKSRQFKKLKRRERRNRQDNKYKINVNKISNLRDKKE